MYSQCFWNHLKIWKPGPEVVNTQARTSSSIWCQQAKYSRLWPNFASSNGHMPLMWPVLMEVVSKHSALIRCCTPQSSNNWLTAVAWASPVQEINFCTPRIWFVSNPDTITGKQSTNSFPVRSFKCFPSQWTVSGILG